MSDGISVYVFTTDMEPIHRVNLPTPPRKGDHIGVHDSLYQVQTVTWEFDAGKPTVQLRCDVIDDGEVTDA